MDDLEGGFVFFFSWKQSSLCLVTAVLLPTCGTYLLKSHLYFLLSAQAEL